MGMQNVWQTLVVVLGAAAAVASAGSNEEVVRPTPYQPGAWNGGYYTQDLGAGLYEIDVHGNVATTVGVAMGYAYRRANEVCPGGYDIVDSNRAVKSETIAESHGVAGPAFGDVVSKSTTEVYTEQKPRITLIIRCKSTCSRPDCNGATDPK